MSVSSAAEQRAALHAILSSSLFSRNPRLSSLLDYLCERAFRGDRSSIKEYDIATDVFHRSTEFDQTTDAIVRVEMHRLRKKLREYYAAEGAKEPVEIVLQTGRYLPEFMSRGVQAQQPAPAAPDRARPLLEVMAPLLATPEPTSGRAAERLLTTRVDEASKAVWLRSAGFLVLVLAVSGAVWLTYHRQQVKAATAAAIGEPHRMVPAVVPFTGAIRLLCGSNATGFHDRAGNEWLPDAYYSGGQAVELPARPIFRTRDPFLYRAMRTGEFTYKIPLRPGTYQLMLHFADLSYRPGIEMEGGENARVFNIWLNGSPLLHELDIFAEAGPDTALVRVYKDVHPAEDGYLHLAFAKQIDLPLLNAIEILPATPHRLLPIRLTTEDRAFTDRDGSTWMPDNFFLHGRTQARFGKIAGAFDQQIYGRERYGHFSYALPVAPGSRYKLKLYFAETYWGPDLQGGGGVGNRVFSVYCNGSVLLKDFDIYKAAGSNQGVVKTFSDLQPNAEGALLVDFAPARNYANVSAIEVEDQGR